MPSLTDKVAIGLQDKPARGDSFFHREGIGLGWHCVVYLLVVAALYTRVPSMFLHAQFYAEDGVYWYAQAYNGSWAHSILFPLGGYLNVLSRLVAGIALLVPLRHAPLVMNCAGILVQALPVTALLSARCRTWGSLPLRILMATIYVVAPNAHEIHVVLTNAHWHLAVLELFLAFGAAPRSWRGRSTDVAIFLLGSVSNPFCLIQLPLVLFYWWRRRESWTLVIAAILALGSAIQLFTIMHAVRPDYGALGATPRLLIRMVGGNIMLSGMTGLRSVLDTTPSWILLLIAIYGLIVIAWALRVCTLPFRLYSVFAIAVFATALRHPLISGPKALWNELLVDFGARYWYYPMMVFLWAAAICVFQHRSRLFKIAGAFILLVLVRGIVLGWRYNDPVDRHFNLYVDQFEHARPGQDVLFPLNPNPDPWTMDLRKHPQ